MIVHFTRIKSVCFLLLTFYFFQGCLPAPYYQKEESIPQNAWKYTFKPTFIFQIKDTTAHYQPYFIIQHTQAYPYSNIWMWIYIKTPVDSVAKRERVNIVLAEPNGQWMGRGMGEIWEQRMKLVLADEVKFNKPGEYKISFEQNMRINPLPEILHVGLRIEKEFARQ